jgi:hypothetical protein
LPFLEEGAAFDWLTIGETDAGNYQWAKSGGPYTDASTLGPSYRNIVVVETVIPVYRCPSAGLPEHQTDQSNDGYWVMRRVPASYLGVVSGLETRQHPSWRMRYQKSPPQNPDYPGVDGVMVGLHHTEESRTRVALSKIVDGTSKTAMVGEAVHDAETQDARGTQKEVQQGNRKDHWFGGSDDIDTERAGQVYMDMSEFLGSTGVPINVQKGAAENNAMCSNPDSADCQALQLSFGSNHSGIVQMVFCDGHIEAIEENIDRQPWSDFGTRASQVLYTGGGAID